MKSFFNYFGSKTNLLNILQNIAAINLLKYFVLHIMVILQMINFHTTGQKKIFVT